MDKDTEKKLDHDRRLLGELTVSQVQRLNEEAEELLLFAFMVIQSGPPSEVFTQGKSIIERIFGLPIEELAHKMIRPKHITADGSMTLIEPINGTDFSLAELQGYVGGSIEIVPVLDQLAPGGKVIIVCNEEGAINGSDVNMRASMFAGQPIHGNVVVCQSDMVK
jgi:hypothetical protein